MNDDPYCYPGTNVLRNNLDIRDFAQLEIAERVVTRARMREPLPATPELTPDGSNPLAYFPRRLSLGR